MKENYKAWQIDIKDFYNLKETNDKLRFLIRFGILAPSSHNAQPWNFSVDDEEIDILLDMERTLLIGDADNRQSCISLGCAVANVITAADYYGYDAEVIYKKVAPVGASVAKIIFRSGPAE